MFENHYVLDSSFKVGVGFHTFHFRLRLSRNYFHTIKINKKKSINTTFIIFLNLYKFYYF